MTAELIRLVGNSLVLGMLELLAESMTLADQTGVGSDTLLDLIKEIHPSPSMVRYGTRVGVLQAQLTTDQGEQLSQRGRFRHWRWFEGR